MSVIFNETSIDEYFENEARIEDDEIVLPSKDIESSYERFSINISGRTFNDSKDVLCHITFKMEDTEITSFTVHDNFTLDELQDIVHDVVENIEKVGESNEYLGDNLEEKINTEIAEVNVEKAYNYHMEFPETHKLHPFFVRVTVKHEDNIIRERIAPDFNMYISTSIREKEDAENLLDEKFVIQHAVEEENPDNYTYSANREEFDSEKKVIENINTQIIRFEDNL